MRIKPITIVGIALIVLGLLGAGLFTLIESHPVLGGILGGLVMPLPALALALFIGLLGLQLDQLTPGDIFGQAEDQRRSPV